ncbi:MAG: hypothetical protein HUK02_09030 [Bacteroidaceae bacterium]|nr:hypothetical protein [Bacteroidaceae bacterium]
MIKKIVFSAAVLCLSTSAMAGGLLTNTNANAAYVRQMAQDGVIDISALYANPAGTGFLNNGWHFALASQTARQRRLIETTFDPFMLNANNHSNVRNIEGKAFAPVVPGFSVSYNHDKWSVNAHLGLTGGGGKCDFAEGLSSFEALTYQSALEGIVGQYGPALIQSMMQQGMTLEQATAALPQAANNVLAQNGGYSLRSNMKGRSYYFGFQVGATYKFMPNLAGYLGVRGTYATCNYNGAISDIMVAGQPAMHQLPDGSVHSAEITLNTDQTGFGVTPIIGLDWKINNQWNVAAKFEAPTKMSLKNDSELSTHAEGMSKDPSSVLSQFADGAKVREDIPGILTFGVQYSPIERVRLNAAFHEFFDKSAKKYGNKEDLIDHNTWELIGGVEFDACKLVTISASAQSTHYGLSDAYMNDLSFNNSNNMIGAGLRFNCNKHCSVDLGYMHTFYKDRTVTTPTAAGNKVDVYTRKNDVVAVGVNVAF